MLFSPAAHEPLTDTLWSADGARDAIAAIVDDAERAFDDGWPVHPLDENGLAPKPHGLCLGGAGVVAALHRLGSERDRVPYLERALEAGPDFPDYVSAGSLWVGEVGIRLVLQRTGSGHSISTARRGGGSDRPTASPAARWHSRTCRTSPRRSSALPSRRTASSTGRPSPAHVSRPSVTARRSATGRLGTPTHSLRCWSARATRSGSSARGRSRCTRPSRSSAPRAEYGRGRYSLWSGDLGTALYLADCIDGRGKLPLP